MARKDIRARIQDGMQAAAHLSAAAVRARDEGSLTRMQLCDMLRAYVLAKYQIDSGCTQSYDLGELAQRSLDIALAKDPGLAAHETLSATCDGASSVDMKQALLLMAVQRDFDVEFTGFDVAFCDTVDQIAELIGDYYGLT